jgi:glutamyl-tRNA reductase
MAMSALVQVGVTHASAPVAWRERLAVGARDVGRAAGRLAASASAREAMVLSTCSRVEAYAVGANAGEVESELLGWFAARAGCALEELAGVVDVRYGVLLRTAAGLDSAVLGEPEIAGQVRRAHRRAVDAGAAGLLLDQLVVHALRAGRRVRAETGLSEGAVSLGSTVALLARGVVGEPHGRRALVIGATRTAGGAADRLLADRWDVTRLPAPTKLAPLLAEFDVVVFCTGGGAGVRQEALRPTGDERRGAPLLVADLSVPRDVVPAGRPVPGVLLYDVDDIAGAAQHALAARRAHVPAAEAIVDAELCSFERWLATRALVPTIRALREHHRRAVVDVLGELPEEVVERLVNRLLHGPTARLRSAAVEGVGEQWAQRARDLFAVAA